MHLGFNVFGLFEENEKHFKRLVEWYIHQRRPWTNQRRRWEIRLKFD
jgi:hypothetical protein